MKGLKLDYETADRITLATLVQSRKVLKKELELHKEGEWMHEDDVKLNKKMIKAMNKIIWYYGGDLDEA